VKYVVSKTTRREGDIECLHKSEIIIIKVIVLRIFKRVGLI